MHAQDAAAKGNSFADEAKKSLIDSRPGPRSVQDSETSTAAQHLVPEAKGRASAVQGTDDIKSAGDGRAEIRESVRAQAGDGSEQGRTAPPTAKELHYGRVHEQPVGSKQ